MYTHLVKFLNFCCVGACDVGDLQDLTASQRCRNCWQAQIVPDLSEREKED